MPIEWGEVPPDHPMFSGQVFFAFRNDLPEQDESEVERDDVDERSTD